ncbi:uncharacterized protein LOC111432144 isoform X1 [Cucurbita moschata]|uniref:Uncharacterized protein LOC111432144 isoform X1 n=2 Tax=Cucurbita moschata TaxID=3662 RepID=A0A6J1EDB0_CUCMO|nr:uncharacterized protein LOC111432144 isoform X1 [Cucurbita moschata]
MRPDPVRTREHTDGGFTEGKKENGGDWMASPSSSPSYLNSTRGLLACLDLNEKHAESMKEMETEWIMDVPDTPDRLAARQSNGGHFVQTETDSSLSNRLRNPDFMTEKGMNGMKGLGVLVSENVDELRLDSSSKNIPGENFKGHRNTIVLSPGDDSALKNNLLLRKGGREKYSYQGPKRFICPRRLDKGITISVDSPSKPPPCQENPQTFNRNVSKDCKIENTSNEQSARYIPISPKKPNMNIKGKEKVVEESFQDVGLSMIHRKGVEKSNNTNTRHEKQVLGHRQFASSPRATGHKRLVRNGCISPHNVTIRAKNLSEQCEKSSRAVDENNLRNMPSNSPSCPIDINDIVAEDNRSSKDKGKGIMRQPSVSHDNDYVRVISASSSDTEKAVGANPARTSRLGTSECFEEVGVWRRTHNHSRKGIALSNPSGSSFKKIDNVGRFSNGKTEIFMERQIPSGQEHVAETDCAGNGDTSQRASSIVPKIEQTIVPMHVESKLNKKQRKHGSTSQINTSCPIPDVVYLGTSEESSNSRSTRLQSRRIRDSLNEVIEVDELSPEMRHPVSQNVGSLNDNTSDARARQLEADEMLARELQEQLYQEIPIGGEEIDEHLAMALQQVEHGHFAPSRQTYSSQRGSLVAQANRRTRSQSSQNSSNITRTRVTHSTRMAQMRNQFFGGSHRVSTRQRNVNFPVHMDLDMRLDILEALEAAVGEMEDARMNRDILHSRRDFNENDYEMLLSLDENNHRHAGASTNRINSLPQSTVQTDSMEDPCAICLDTPAIGDVIRHLPCLHKFHKDCIDPWLQRRTSCPVCKSSIT